MINAQVESCVFAYFDVELDDEMFVEDVLDSGDNIFSLAFRELDFCRRLQDTTIGSEFGYSLQLLSVLLSGGGGGSDSFGTSA